MSYSPTAAEESVRIARGILAAAAPDRIVLSVPNTDYQLHLIVEHPPTTPIGKRIAGVIRAQGRRIDVVQTGGSYIEPVYGRPRRIQGPIVAIDPATQAVTVDAAVPIVCKTDGRQRAEQFRIGDFVALDLIPGAFFAPVE